MGSYDQQGKMKKMPHVRTLVLALIIWRMESDPVVWNQPVDGHKQGVTQNYVQQFTLDVRLRLSWKISRRQSLQSNTVESRFTAD